MKKKEPDLKKELECYRIPAPDQSAKESCKEELRKIKMPYQMTDGQFILGQLGFIKPYIWFGQIAILFVALIAILYFGKELPYTSYTQLSLLSAMTPLFLIFQIEELAKIYNRSMLEIEMATKYSLKKLVLSRLCILGITDLAVLGVWIFFLNCYLKENLFGILLYTLVPFNITVAGMLYLKYSGKGMYAYQALSYTVFVCVCFIVIPHERPLIYNSRYLDIWMLMYVLSLFGLVKNIKELWKNMEHGERLLMTER